VSESRRFHLRLPPELKAELSGFARSHGLGLGPAIRLLVGHALSAEGLTRAVSTTPQDSPAALAALTAAEHAVLMVASVLPEGERRMRSLAERATEAAGERLALFQPPSDSGEERP
jgi:hypothetical protein